MIQVSKIDADLLPSFDVVWAMKPTERGQVCTAKGSTSAHRWYKSYGAVPPRSADSLSYMFSDGNITAFDPIPDIFKPLLREADNQIVVNWYVDENDYCPYHRDCLDHMSDGASVAIINLVPLGEPLRELVFCPGAGERYERFACHHGSCITFSGDALTKWRHGVPKAKGRRISISLRQYN